ncbi:MAG: hypothetical protein V4489_07635 [Chlamydiota bacterium]
MIAVILFLKNTGRLQEMKVLEKENALRSSAGQPTNVKSENTNYQNLQAEGELDATKIEK